MKNRQITKKIGIAVLTFGLAVSGIAPSANAAFAASQTSARAESTANTDSQKTAKGFTITKKTYQYDYKTKDGKTYKSVSFTYPSAAGSRTAVKKFNQFYEKMLKNWKKQSKKDLAEAKELVSKREDDVCYGDDVTCSVTTNTKDYVSILEQGYVYTLGAHGLPYRYSNIFDPKTGNELTAAKLLGISKQQVNEKVRSLYLQKYDKTKGEEFLGSRAEVKKVLEQIDFNKRRCYLKNGKLRFYVEPYAVGPYAAGYIEVAIKCN